MKTQREQYEEALAEAKSLNIDTDKLMEPTKGKWITLKQRTAMLQDAVAEQNKKLSEEIEQTISPKKDTTEPKPSGKVEMVSNTSEGRSKFLSEYKKQHKERNP